jgi:hypothetical protein
VNEVVVSAVVCCVLQMKAVVVLFGVGGSCKLVGS